MLFFNKVKVISLLQKLKTIRFSKSRIIMIVGITAVALVFTNIFVLHDRATRTDLVTKSSPTPSPTGSPSPTEIITPTIVQKMKVFVSPTITPSVTPKPTTAKEQGLSESLSISTAEPNFLWADYLNLGYHYVHIKGSGFTNHTQFAFVAEGNGQVYYIGNVSLPSSHEFYGTLPSGLYNSYYKVSAHRYADNAYVETGSVLVVSGSTQEQGTAPPPEYYYPTNTPTPSISTTP